MDINLHDLLKKPWNMVPQASLLETQGKQLVKTNGTKQSASRLMTIRGKSEKNKEKNSQHSFPGYWEADFGSSAGSELC